MKLSLSRPFWKVTTALVIAGALLLAHEYGTTGRIVSLDYLTHRILSPFYQTFVNSRFDFDPALIGEDDAARAVAVAALQQGPRLTRLSVIHDLTAIAADPFNPARRLAIFSLGRFGPAAASAMQPVSRALKSNDYDTRWCALDTLGRMGEYARPVAARIRPLLKYPNKYDRAGAAINLVKTGGVGDAYDAVVQELTAALGYPDPWVRREAASTLGNLTPPAAPAVPRLLESAVNDEEAQGIRAAAVWAIGRTGLWSPQVKLALLLALKDEDRLLQLNALTALQMLDPGDPTVDPLVAEVKSQWTAADFSAALLYAAWEGELSTARALVALGADIEAKGFYSGMTPLMIAAEQGHLDIVEWLLENGADVDRPSDSRGLNLNLREPFIDPWAGTFTGRAAPAAKAWPYSGRTALMHAVTAEVPVERILAIERALLAAGASLSVADRDGNDALALARTHYRVRVLRDFMIHRAQHPPEPAASATVVPMTTAAPQPVVMRNDPGSGTKVFFRGDELVAKYSAASGRLLGTVPDGPVQEEWPDGLTRELTFRNNQPLYDTNRVYDEAGELPAGLRLVDGKLNGTLEQFVDGHLGVELTFENGYQMRDVTYAPQGYRVADGFIDYDHDLTVITYYYPDGQVRGETVWAGTPLFLREVVKQEWFEAGDGEETTSGK